MTLKQIAPSEVEMGMFIHSFQGNWLNHPFWRAKFLLADEDRLEAVRESALDGVIIDTERGKDIITKSSPTPTPPCAQAVRTPDRIVAPRPAAARFASAAPVFASAGKTGGPGITREFGNAKHTAGVARKVISKIFIEARLGKAPKVSAVTPVVEDIYASIERNPHAFSGLMRCKVEMEAIYRHMLSVSALMVSLARQMKLSPQETRTAGMAGLLLDVGVSRLDIDAAQLAGGLDRIDIDVWKTHCYVGHDLLAATEDVPEEVLHAVLHHHELMDGTGFPQGLEERQIDTLSRMAAICDRFDLLVSGGLTGDSVDPAEAMRIMMSMEGAFDAEILDRFREALGVYPVGSFVMLRSGRVAMVIDQDLSDPALPTVYAFHSAATGKPAKARTIALAECYGTDAIAGVADLVELGLGSAQDLRTRVMTSLAREK